MPKKLQTERMNLGFAPGSKTADVNLRDTYGVRKILPV